MQLAQHLYTGGCCSLLSAKETASQILNKQPSEALT